MTRLSFLWSIAGFFGIGQAIADRHKLSAHDLMPCEGAPTPCDPDADSKKGKRSSKVGEDFCPLGHWQVPTHFWVHGKMANPEDDLAHETIAILKICSKTRDGRPCGIVYW